MKQKRRRPERIELREDELEEVLARAETALCAADHETLKAALETLAWLTGELEAKNVSLARLRKILFGAKTERTRDVVAREGGGLAEEDHEVPSPDPEVGGAQRAPALDANKPKGHGRNGASAYAGAEKMAVAHASLRAGDRCPECPKGKVYRLEPRVLVRVRGQPPLQATVWELERLRCNLCGEVFRAKAPRGVGDQKYDASSASMIALLKYGGGLPFHRLERLERNLGIPLPAATQWGIVESAARRIAPLYEELVRQAAQGDVVHNDDTTMKILSLMEENARVRESGETGARTGIFTSGIVSLREGHRIALFFTGRQHAGENLAKVLAQRASKLGPPIQMCDGLSRNVPAEFETLLANCIAHGRRKFVEVVGSFPKQCRTVLETLGDVYGHDAQAREQNLSAEERLRFHQTHSKPLLDELEQWLTDQIAEKKVEPNSGLGEAIAYMLERWEKMTLFLREPGAPLDNNVCERALKKAILHRLCGAPHSRCYAEIGTMRS